MVYIEDAASTERAILVLGLIVSTASVLASLSVHKGLNSRAKQH